MAKTKYKKNDLRGILENKRNELIKEKITPLENELREIRQSLKLKKAEKSGVDIDQLAKDIYEAGLRASLVRDAGNIYYGTLRQIAYYANETVGANDEEKIADLKDDIVSDVQLESTDYDDRANEIEVELQDLKERIRAQFIKLDAVVTSRTANQAAELLKEAGFDLSSLENVEPKMEIKALDIDSELLGLPEGVQADGSETSETVE